MSWNAYVDESVRFGTKPGYYVLAAALVEDSAAAAFREVVAPLAHRPKGFHWTEADQQRRWTAVEAVRSANALHLVVVGAPMDPARQERARRGCLERLLFELDAAGITQVLLESRTATLNRKDQQVVGGFLARKVIRHVRIKHTAAVNEPLLWVPDIVAGAVGLDAEGRESKYWQRLAGLVERYEIQLR